MDDLGFGPSIYIVVEQNALLKEHVHLVIVLIVTRATLLLVDIQVEHLFETSSGDLVGLNWFG